MKLKLYEDFSKANLKKFNIGDRVVYKHIIVDDDDTDDDDYNHVIGDYQTLNGNTGTILQLYHKPATWCVRFDHKFSKGHSCEGKCENGFGYFVDEVFLEHLEKQPPPIIRWYKKGKLTKE